MANRSWQIGPRGGKFYVDAQGEKKYGEEALQAERVLKLQAIRAGGVPEPKAALAKLAQARQPPHLEYGVDGQLTVAPLSRGPGPVISSAQADSFTKDSKLPQAFVRGTQRPNEGAFISKESENLSLQGRGIYMVQAEDAHQVAKYGVKQELRVNVRNPIDRYGKEGKAIADSDEYKKTLAHLEKHSPQRHWQSQAAIAFQAVAQRRGHDATYFVIHEKAPGGGEVNTGRIALTVWDANKVAVVKD